MARVVGARAAFAFAGIAWQLDAVDGEHLASDQPLRVADVQDAREQRGDLPVEVRQHAGRVCLKCGHWSPDSAMKTICSRQARSMARELTMPRL